MLPLIQRRTITLATASTTDISFPRIKPGQLWRVTRLVLSDDAAGDITVLFGVTDITGFSPLTEQILLQTGDAAAEHCDFALGEEDVLTARVTTTTGAGNVTFQAYGEILTREAVIVVETPAAPAKGAAKP